MFLLADAVLEAVSTSVNSTRVLVCVSFLLHLLDQQEDAQRELSVCLALATLSSLIPQIQETPLRVVVVVVHASTLESSAKTCRLQKGDNSSRSQNANDGSMRYIKGRQPGGSLQVSRKRQRAETGRGLGKAICQENLQRSIVVVVVANATILFSTTTAASEF
jgi:hypothetical protein